MSLLSTVWEQLLNYCFSFRGPAQCYNFTMAVWIWREQTLSSPAERPVSIWADLLIDAWWDTPKFLSWRMCIYHLVDQNMLLETISFYYSEKHWTIDTIHALCFICLSLLMCWKCRLIITTCWPRPAASSALLPVTESISDTPAAVQEGSQGAAHSCYIAPSWILKIHWHRM